MINKKLQEERLLMDLYYNEIAMITFISSTETYINCMVLSDLILFSTLLTYKINKNKLSATKPLEANLSSNFI